MNSFSILNDVIFPGVIIIAQILAVLMPVLISVAFLVYAERKVLALIQLRRGPNVVGPFGIFQSFADALKLLTKENIVPSNSNKVVNTSDKDILGDVYYMNGSIMVMKRSAVFSKSNKLPFPWLGDKVVPIEQDPICMELDAQWQTSIIQLISDDNSIAR